MGIWMSLFNRRNALTLPEELVLPAKSLLQMLFHLTIYYIEIVMGIWMSLFSRQNAPTLLPDDLVFSEILPKLPTKSLIRFKSVSKEWRDFIANDAGLKKAHAHRHNAAAQNSGEISNMVALKKKYDKSDQKLVLLTGDGGPAREFETPRELKDMRFEIILSSYGLVLLLKPLVLWNPATKESRVLPEPIHDLILVPEGYSPILGLGFDEESDDHKVVRVSGDPNNHSEAWSLNLQVFSKRAGSWKKLRSIPGFTICKASFGADRVSSDKALYFLAEQGYTKLAVMSFTYRNEELRKLTDGPNYEPLPGPDRRYHIRLVKWKEDSLALLSRDTASEKPSVCDFWVMAKNSGDEGFSWSKLFALDCCYGDIRGVWSDRFVINWNRKITLLSWWDRTVIGFKEKTELALWDPHTDGEKRNCVVLAELDEPITCYFGGASMDAYVPTLLSLY